MNNIIDSFSLKETGKKKKTQKNRATAHLLQARFMMHVEIKESYLLSDYAANGAISSISWSQSSV